MKLDNLSINSVKSFFGTKSKVIILIIFSSFLIIPVHGDPILKNDQFLVEKYVEGLEMPTTMSFIGSDVFVLQKNDGKVFLIRDGVLQENPILDVNVNSAGEMGLLGILTKNSSVYLYFTEANEDGGEQIANRIYRYLWDGHDLKQPILVNEFPKSPFTVHVGGVMTSDLEGNIFAVIGDMKFPEKKIKGITQNDPDGKVYDNGIIVIVGLDDSIIHPSESSEPFDHYYAIGIRNSFGITVDPVTGNMWDTENGPTNYDEVNLVEPKFNSGWNKIQGPASAEEISDLPVIDDFRYSDPEFSWEKPIAPTGLTFVNSTTFSEYQNSLLVADCINGNIYKFELNSKRTGFVFKNNELSDKVFNAGENLEEIIFGTGFGCITDIKFGPDGFLYVVSLTEGVIYRIVPFEKSIEKISLLELADNLKPYGNLTNADLRFANLTNADLRFANLTNADLRFANLTNANLSGTYLLGANLQNADLTRADLSRAVLTNTILKQAILKNSNLEKVTITNSNAQAAYFGYSTLNEAHLSDSNFRASVFTNSEMIGANLENSSFFGSDLSFSNLRGANLKNAVFLYANLSYADISEVNLYGADLSFADLSFADLTRSDFTHSEMIGTNLENSLFFRSDLSFSNLRGANLKNAVFLYANLSYADISEVNLSGADLRFANLTKADLTATDLSDAKLSNTNLSDAIIKDTKGEHCIGEDLWNSTLAKILGKVRSMNNDILKPIEWIILQLCTSP